MRVLRINGPIWRMQELKAKAKDKLEYTDEASINLEVLHQKDEWLLPYTSPPVFYLSVLYRYMTDYRNPGSVQDAKWGYELAEAKIILGRCIARGFVIFQEDKLFITATGEQFAEGYWGLINECWNSLGDWRTLIVTLGTAYFGQVHIGTALIYLIKHIITK